MILMKIYAPDVSFKNQVPVQRAQPMDFYDFNNAPHPSPLPTILLLYLKIMCVIYTTRLLKIICTIMSQAERDNRPHFWVAEIWF